MRGHNTDMARLLDDASAIAELEAWEMEMQVSRLLNQAEQLLSLLEQGAREEDGAAECGRLIQESWRKANLMKSLSPAKYEKERVYRAVGENISSLASRLSRIVGGSPRAIQSPSAKLLPPDRQSFHHASGGDESGKSGRGAVVHAVVIPEQEAARPSPSSQPRVLKLRVGSSDSTEDRASSTSPQIHKKTRDVPKSNTKPIPVDTKPIPGETWSSSPKTFAEQQIPHRSLVNQFDRSTGSKGFDATQNRARISSQLKAFRDQQALRLNRHQDGSCQSRLNYSDLETIVRAEELSYYGNSPVRYSSPTSDDLTAKELMTSSSASGSELRGNISRSNNMLSNLGDSVMTPTNAKSTQDNTTSGEQANKEKLESMNSTTRDYLQSVAETPIFRPSSRVLDFSGQAEAGPLKTKASQNVQTQVLDAAEGVGENLFRPTPWAPIVANNSKDVLNLEDRRRKGKVEWSSTWEQQLFGARLNSNVFPGKPSAQPSAAARGGSKGEQGQSNREDAATKEPAVPIPAPSAWIPVLEDEQPSEVSDAALTCQQEAISKSQIVAPHDLMPKPVADTTKSKVPEVTLQQTPRMSEAEETQQAALMSMIIDLGGQLDSTKVARLHSEHRSKELTEKLYAMQLSHIPAPKSTRKGMNEGDDVILLESQVRRLRQEIARLEDPVVASHKEFDSWRWERLISRLLASHAPFVSMLRIRTAQIARVIRHRGEEVEPYRRCSPRRASMSWRSNVSEESGVGDQSLQTLQWACIIGHGQVLLLCSELQDIISQISQMQERVAQEILSEGDLPKYQGASDAQLEHAVVEDLIANSSPAIGQTEALWRQSILTIPEESSGIQSCAQISKVGPARTEGIKTADTGNNSSAPERPIYNERNSVSSLRNGLENMVDEEAMCEAYRSELLALLDPLQEHLGSELTGSFCTVHDRVITGLLQRINTQKKSLADLHLQQSQSQSKAGPTMNQISR